MTTGPGKYDAVCSAVREETKAAGVIVIVIDGERGSGFSCQTDASTLARLPELLEAMAAQMRKDRERVT